MLCRPLLITPRIKENNLQDSTLRPVLFMVGSMALFSLEDFFIKLLSKTVPASQIMIILGILGSAFFVTVAILAKQPIISRDLLDKHVVIRTLGDLFGALFFVSAVVLTPLSSASAILQGTPLAVTAGAAIFLREKVGFRRWLAVLVGFIGIILIIKPGVADFSPLSLFAVAAVICLSARDLATRAMTDTLPTITISIYAFVALAVAGVLAIPFYGSFVAPGLSECSLFLLGVSSGVIAYYLIVGATRHGDASLIAPFRYSRLVFAMLLSLFILGERPDLLTWIGALVIVLSGYFVALRERKIKNVER